MWLVTGFHKGLYAGEGEGKAYDMVDGGKGSDGRCEEVLSGGCRMGFEKLGLGLAYLSEEGESCCVVVTYSSRIEVPSFGGPLESVSL